MKKPQLIHSLLAAALVCAERFAELAKVRK